jgi:long-chain acyl-CoA synthetase
LKEKGYKPGTVISMHLYNSAEAAVVLLAAQYIGCVICLIDPLFKPGELNYYVKDSDSKCLITYLKKEDVLLEEGLEVDIINVGEIEEACRIPLADYSLVENDNLRR